MIMDKYLFYITSKNELNTEDLWLYLYIKSHFSPNEYNFIIVVHLRVEVSRTIFN